MADFFKNLDKNVKDWHILVVLGLLVLGYILYEYCGKQNLLVSNFQGVSSQDISPSNIPGNAQRRTGQRVVSNTAVPSNQVGSVVGFDRNIDNLNSGATDLAQGQVQLDGRAPSARTTRQMDFDPSQLLPGSNNEWGHLRTTGGMENINFLTNIQNGIGMVSQSLRNANKQLRADPVIPQQNIQNMQGMTCLCAPMSTIGPENTGFGFEVCGTNNQQ